MAILEGKVVIVTGGARGMGAQHVRHFVAEGAKVVFGDVLDDAGENLAAEVGPDCQFVHQDVTSESDWKAVVDATTSRFGRIDGLVNNAGILAFQPMAQMSHDGFKAMLDVNVGGSWLGMRAVAEAMTEARGGSIVNVSSVEGMVGAAGLTAYSASKFAVRGMTKAAAQELGPAGIRVNSVHPGAIATPMTQMFQGKSGVDETDFLVGLPIARWGQPEEVSPLAAFLLSDLSSYCTGSEYVVDGGMISGAGY